MFGNLKILESPEGWDFEFRIIDGKLRVINKEVPHQPWDIEIDGPFLPGEGIVRVSSRQLPVRLQAEPTGDLLQIVISKLIPDESLVWKVSRLEFNRLLDETYGMSEYVAIYLGANVITTGRRWIDEGFE